ncbi:hypothetical protein [Pseudomonas putida]|uniref:Uncharacterized protein n=1 Tax=Pseudomonas putida TaxID=303 RepID=A0A1L7NPX4_PSEPU|nr:hypothetical protein [Pseudomonas putida]BAW27501.1 Uncharacterized protein KF715C_pC680 [Pseudomonas putida]
MQDQSNTAPAQAPDIEDQVGELFDALEGLPEDVTNEALHAALLAQSDKIRAIADACERTRIYLRAKGQVDEFAGEIEATQPPEGRLVAAWLWLLGRMAGAPTFFHTIGAVRLCMPLVARFLPAPAAQASSEQEAGL